MLTPDHPGLNRVPQDLRNPGAARAAAQWDRGHCRGSGSRAGAPAQTLGVWTGAPRHPHTRPLRRARLCSSGEGLAALPGPPAGLPSPPPAAPTPGPTLPPDVPLALISAPDGATAALCPGPQEAGGGWNVRCLRSQPESDLSWAEMRGKRPRTTHSFTAFPDLAAAGAGLPNQAGFGQDMCSSAGHKAHLDPLRELRAIKFS